MFPQFVNVRTTPHPSPPHAWGGGRRRPHRVGKAGKGSFVRRFAAVAHSGNLNRPGVAANGPGSGDRTFPFELHPGMPKAPHDWRGNPYVFG